MMSVGNALGKHTDCSDSFIGIARMILTGSSLENSFCFESFERLSNRLSHRQVQCKRLKVILLVLLDLINIKSEIHIL